MPDGTTDAGAITVADEAMSAQTSKSGQGLATRDNPDAERHRSHGIGQSDASLVRRHKSNESLAPCLSASRFSLLVPDYDTALDFFCRIGFECREDTDLGNGKRWVRIAPPAAETEILLARADGARQSASIGEQGGGRVWLFLETANFERDYHRLQAVGVEFETLPRDEAYGRVVVWKDPWGNRWDLIEFTHPDRKGTSG